ncbi:MAG: 4'-phosphopantetheinyl transferase superfamily protein [Rikenellaceae bacterium]
MRECAEFSPKRQRERLSWRAILRRELSRESYKELSIPHDFRVRYSCTGAPYVVGCDNLYISVSHSSSHVALLLSTKRCGVDIEQRARNFERVASRYITTKEQSVMEGHDSQLLMALFWAAKEAIYKYSGAVGIDMLCDICITSINATNNKINATLLNEELQLEYKIYNNFVVCWII